MARVKPFWTLDAETDPFKAGRIPAPFIWGLYDGEHEDYYEFDTPAAVADFISSRAILVYAHNGGKFDYHYLRDWINSDDPLMVISGRLARFKIGEAECRDSINILVNPLRAFAKEEIDYQKLEADVRHQHMEEIRRYLKSDCVNLWNTIKAYNDQYGRSLTQAGASMRYWKEHYEVPMKPQTAAQSAYYREFYYGGRVQCFAQGEARVTFDVADLNSAYPHAMLMRHPLSPVGILEDHLPTGDELGPCLIRLDAIARGCFPLRAEDGSVYFPDDDRSVREYAITGWELLAALEYDAVKIIHIKEIRRFVHLVDFKEYIEHFYCERLAAKASGNKMQDVFAKLFMNSLYGKFAADPAKYHEFVISHRDTPQWLTWQAKGYRSLKAWGERDLLERALPEEKHRYYNVCTAASITGFVRAQLFRAMQKCSGVLYCDTDSIAARSIAALPLGDQLGEWKHELHCDQYGIAGKKLYAFHGVKPGEDIPLWKTACKGVRLEPAQILQAARGETVLFEPDVPTYSFLRDEPIFVSRNVKNTFKDISAVL